METKGRLWQPGHCVVAHTTSARPRLSQGQESDIAGADLLEETINLARISDIPVIDLTQGIERDPVLLQTPVTSHC